MRCCDWNLDDIWKENYTLLNYRCIIGVSNKISLLQATDW